MPARGLNIPPGVTPEVVGPGALVISVGCRDVRRRLGPMTWTVLEELALDAHPDGAGGFWARTSARLIAGHLGIESGTAASALRRLRADGLVTLSREPGPAGRFGRSVYWIASIPGVTFTDQPVPCVDSPRMVGPQSDLPGTVEPDVVEPEVVEPEVVEPEVVEPEVVKPETVKPETVKPETVEAVMGEPAVGEPAVGGPVAAKGAARVSRTKRALRSEALTLWDTPSIG